MGWLAMQQMYILAWMEQKREKNEKSKAQHQTWNEFNDKEEVIRETR